jgi:hypothetical protein
MTKPPPISILFALTGVVGCGGASDEGPVLPRRAAVLVDGCALDGWQQATLAAVETTRVLDEVVLRCLSLREDGSIAPGDMTSRAALKDTTAELQKHGYLVSLAVTARSADGNEFTPEKLLEILQNSGFRSRATAELTSFAPTGNFIELALPPLPDSGRPVFKQWVDELATALRPLTRLGLLAPPSITQPSDVPGGVAVDLTNTAASFDRVRLMTLDYSWGETAGGPTTEPYWIAEVASFAQMRGATTGALFDVALPLYGVDFSARGERTVSYLEAVGLAQHNARQIERAPGKSLHFEWSEADGTGHQIWFDDSAALIDYQRLFDPMIDSGTGILYYGLGYEDPSFFAQLSRRR